MLTADDLFVCLACIAWAMGIVFVIAEILEEKKP